MNKKIIILGAVILAVGGVIFYKNINTFDPSVDTRTLRPPESLKIITKI